MKQSDPFDAQSPFEILENARRNRLLTDITRGTTIAMIPIIILFGAMLVNNPSWQIMLVCFITLLIIPMTVATRFVSKREHTHMGSYILLLYFLVVVAINGILLEGLLYAIAPAFAVILIMGGMLLSRLGSYTLAAAAAAVWLIVRYIITAGWLPPVPVNASLLDITLILIVVVSFLFTTFISHLATADLHRALEDATYDLVQANIQSEKASKLKSQFTARTSHELRTPLSAIITFTDLALRKAYGPLNAKLEDSLQRVLNNGRHLHALIEDILDLSKIEAGETEMVAQEFPINRLTDAVRSTLEPAAHRKNITLSVSLSSDMPAYIVGDEKRLSQVLLNLTDNAIKFTDAGKVDVLIAPLSKEEWQMRVQDSGRGIHEKDFKMIFEEFHQVDNIRTSKKKGTGLGLSITRHLVEDMMGGEIVLQSEIGKGSTFQVILPFTMAD